MDQVRTFQATTMQEALTIVRHSMGEEAVILHTRQISKRRLMPWSKPKQLVEITAGYDKAIEPAVERLAKRRQQATSQTTRSDAQHSLAATTAKQLPATAQTASQPTTAHLQSEPIQQTLPTDINHSNRVSQLNSRSVAVHSGRKADSTNVTESQEPRRPGRRPRKRRRRSNSQPPQHHRLTRMQAEFTNRIDRIEKMLASLERFSELPKLDDLPGELFDLYTELIDSEIEPTFARDLVKRLKENCTADQLSNSSSAKALLRALIESELTCSGPIVPAPGNPKVVALVGPTGVGKTTTIAKLAANFRIRDNIRMGLITVDTFRIAAVEQLRTYADIINLPMKVVTNPLEMRQAIDELTGLDLILIDTAGRSPQDELQINELNSLLSEANVDEVHLVLSTTASTTNMKSTVEKFSTTGLTSLILTKLDEATHLGSILALNQETGLPISYITTGQDVPHDIETAHVARLTEMILGDHHNSQQAPPQLT